MRTQKEEIDMFRKMSLCFFVLPLLVVLLPQPAAAQHYKQTNLVSDVPGLAASTDPDLVNPWGLTRSATSPWWVSDNGTGKSTLYNGAGNKLALVVTVAPPRAARPPVSSSTAAQDLW